MPRRPRLHVPAGFYHVTLRGNHQQPVFVEQGDQRLLNKIVARALGQAAARLHAYCWMTNHLHMLLQAGHEPLGGPMRQIASEFARAMQRKIPTTGHFFERRYHATLVQSDSHLLEVLRYIHRNPVKARMCTGPGDYAWSSHRSYCGSGAEPWVTTDFLLKMFSDDRAAAIASYVAFVGENSDPDWGAMLETGELEVLGDDDFVNSVSRPAISRRPLSLENLIAEACRRFDVQAERLRSPVRDRYITKVRAWIANQARKRGAGSLSEVARALGRTEATLREAIRRYPGEVE